MDSNSRLHSPEYLQQRIRKFQSLHVTTIHPSNVEPCREFFTKAAWNKQDVRFMLLLEKMMHLELEVSQGKSLSRVSKAEIQQWFGQRLYRQVVCPRIKPVNRGHHESKRANEYAGTNYVLAGLTFIDRLADPVLAAACRRRVLEATPDFYDALFLMKMYPSAMENVPYSFPTVTVAPEMYPSAIGNVPTFKIDSSGSVGSGSTSADASATLTVRLAADASVAAPRLHYDCRFCRKRYVKEAAYTAHRCKERARWEVMQTPEGKRALGIFNKAARMQKRREISEEAFLAMRTSSSWLKFAAWVDKTNIADLSLYISTALAAKVSINLWTTSAVYDKYRMAFITADPMRQVETSVASIKEWAAAATCKTGDVFEMHDFGSIFTQVLTGKLSPWFLMNSTAFKGKFMDFPAPQQALLLEEMKPFTDRFHLSKAATNYAQAEAKALGL